MHNGSMTVSLSPASPDRLEVIRANISRVVFCRRQIASRVEFGHRLVFIQIYSLQLYIMYKSLQFYINSIAVTYCKVLIFVDRLVRLYISLHPE
jgi:hypothetical protein